MEPFICWKDLSEKGGILIPNYLSPISMLRLLCKENMRQSLFHRLSHFFARPQTKTFSMAGNLSERLKFNFLSKIISPQVDCYSSKCRNVSQGIHNTWKCLERLVRILNCLFPTWLLRLPFHWLSHFFVSLPNKDLSQHWPVKIFSGQKVREAIKIQWAGWVLMCKNFWLTQPACATRALKTFLVDKDQDNVSNNLVCAHKRRELKQKRFWSNDSVLGDRINLLVSASLAWIG